VELQLSRDDWTLLALVDGRRTVADIVRLLGRGEYAVVSCLADLMTRGLLVVADIDMAGDLARRLSLLSSAETAEPGAAEVDVVPDPDLEPEVAPEPPVVAVPAQPTHTDVDGQDGGLISDIDAPAEVAPSKPLSRVASSEDRDVTPLRSEAVLPPRQVDFPEPPMARPLAAAVGATPAAALAASIERDPSVNKSLLLRLIAGVRGL
jgi:hypothetical protein